jgi:hypothetical protein
MDRPPRIEFGKRPQAVISPGAESVKRSHHVALLVMGTLAVGGGAYALMPRENCTPNSPAMAAPSGPQGAITCTGSSGSSRSGGWWSRSGFYGGNSASSGTSSASGSTETTRGGFGSFGRAFAAYFSGS